MNVFDEKMNQTTSNNKNEFYFLSMNEILFLFLYLIFNDAGNTDK